MLESKFKYVFCSEKINLNWIKNDWIGIDSFDTVDIMLYDAEEYTQTKRSRLEIPR